MDVQLLCDSTWDQQLLLYRQRLHVNSEWIHVDAAGTDMRHGQSGLTEQVRARRLRRKSAGSETVSNLFSPLLTL